MSAVALALSMVGCTDDGPEPGPDPTTAPTTPSVDQLTFGVYGPEVELAAYRATVDAWNAAGEDRPEVKLRTWPDHAAMRAAIDSGAEVPDVFLASRSDLRWMLDERHNQPVDELLDERGVEFGDGYSRDALQAFSADDRLQCIPYAVSPMVIYYNRALVNFDRMRNRGLPAPEPDASSWSFEQFAAAADFAARPKRETKGVHIAATLSGLAPFIASGGGSVFDDGTDPTSLAFSSDGSRSALERTLELLRNPQLTLDDEQLAEASPVRWFERGRLGMIAGYRSLVPELREVDGLDFDVLPMPVLDSASTVGDVTGMCLSRTSASIPLAADFLVHEISAESVSQVTRTGYLAPANLEVALSDTFLQPGRHPLHAAYFNTSVRSITLPPLIDSLGQVEAAVQPSLEQLVYGVGVLDLDALTEQIDEESRAILSPPEPTESPSGSPTGSETPAD
ncbi:MAG TPA: extracellular solute-binding protein [Nocardioides sp.]|nr:extracellular solute-binding protein [Nocardioides sp.]